MSDAYQYDTSKSSSYVWLSLGFSVLGGIIGFLVGSYIQFRELELKSRDIEIKTMDLKVKQEEKDLKIKDIEIKVKEAELKHLERDDRIHALKLEIVKSIQDAKLAWANAI